MPQILESEAFALAQGIDAMTPENQARAADVLRRYREQQREYGLPDFPTAEQQRREGEDRYFSLFDDLKNVDAASPSFSTGLRLSANPDADRARVVNTAFLARQYGKTAEEVSRAFPFFRDDFAAKSGAEPGLEDAAFYQHAAKIAKGQKATRDVQERSLNEGFRAAVEGMGSLEKLAEVRAQAAGNTDNEIDAKAFLSSYEQTQAIMSKHAGFIREFSDAIASDMDGGQVDLGPLNERLLDLPGTDRRLVIAALYEQAKKGGEKVKEAKGGENQSSQAAKSFAEILTLGQYREGKFFQQTGEAASRLARSAAMDQPRMERLIELVPSSGEVLALGEIKTAEQARAYVRDSLFRSDAAELSAMMAGPGGFGGMPVDDDRVSVTLDAEAQKLIRDAKERELKRLRVQNEIRQIGEIADPIPNVFASTIGTSGAALGLMAGTRGLAAPALWNAYTNIEYNDLSLEYPQMTSADKKLVAGVSAAVQTALDYVGVKALDRLPGIKSLVSQPFTRQLAARALARGGVSFASENVVEAAQDIATPAIIEALRVDAPGFDAAAEARDFWKGRADVAIGLLPLTLLGIGAASVNEYRGAKELLTWNDQLGAAGVVETDRVAIIEAAQAGNTSQAQTILRESWGRRSPEVAAEYQDAMSQRQSDLARATAELERLGAMPTLARDADGWTVSIDGKTAKFAIWEEEREVATAAMNDLEQKQILLATELTDRLLGGKFGDLQETSTLRPQEETLGDNVREGTLTAETAMEAAVAGGIIKGVTMSEARAIAGEVFGDNPSERAMRFREDVESTVILGRNETAGGVSRSTINLADNKAAFLTALEEPLEGRVKHGLTTGVFRRESLAKIIQGVEQATGETFLEGSTWDEIAASNETAPRPLIEAISRVIVADVFGRMKEGKWFAPGSASKSLNLNDREQSAFAAILKMFRDYLVAVLRAASKLAKARQEGKLGGEYDALFDALTGGSSQLEHDAGAIKEADAIAAEAVDTSGYSPENPGPNGETFSLAVQQRGGVPFKAGDRVRSLDFEATVYSVEPRQKLGYWVVYTDVTGKPEWKSEDRRALSPFAKPFDAYSEPVEIVRRGNASPIRNEALEALKEKGDVSAKADVRQIPIREAPKSSVNYTAPKKKGVKASSIKVGDIIDLGGAQTVTSIERRGSGFLWLEFEGGNAGLFSGDSLVNRASRAVPADASKVVQMPDGAQLVGPTTFSIRAYHGTPHKVDKFTTAKIGTGEGAQAYGWGLYFAENEGVATNYQEQLRPRQPDDYDSAFTEAAKSFIASNGNVTLEDLRSAYPNASTAALEWGMREARGQERGNLYTVELLPDEADFLDWDKPLSEQSEKVKAAVSEMWGRMVAESGLTKENEASDEQVAAIQNAAGSSFYEYLAQDDDAETDQGNIKAASEYLASIGIPGIKYLDAGSRGTGDGTRNFVIFDENLVRILEENGRPVEGETFSLRPGDFAARMEAKFSLFQAKPELRLAIAQVAKERALRLGAEWIAKGDVIRTAKDIGKEQAFREADGFDRRMTAYLDGLSENARQTLEFEPSALEGDPLVSAMLDEGKLMSRSTAVKNGVKNLDEYNGVPWLPPAWYSKGAGITPGKMAKALHDGPQDQGGPLRGDSAQDLWDSLAEVIASIRKDKAAHREAVQAYKDAQKAAKTDAKAEAEDWANQARKTAGSPKAQRDMLKAALRTLDGILAAAPPEVRARVGGYVKLAGLATDEAMLAEIERRIDKMNRELEKYLKKEGRAELTRLFKRAAPKNESGEKAQGKIGPEFHAWFALAESAAEMSPEKADEAIVAAEQALEADVTAAQLAGLSVWLGREVSDLDEARTLQDIRLTVLQTFGSTLYSTDAQAPRNAAEIMAAVDAAKEQYIKGRVTHLEKMAARRERRQEWRTKGIALVGGAATGDSVRGQMARSPSDLKRLASDYLDTGLDASGFFRSLLGEGDLYQTVRRSILEADAQEQDAMKARRAEFAKLLKGTFAGGKTARLRGLWELQRIQEGTPLGTFSQMQAVQFTLWFQDLDSREWLASHGYGEEWQAKAEKWLTPEAKKIRAWLLEKYGQQYDRINPVFRELRGVNLPRVEAYGGMRQVENMGKDGSVALTADNMAGGMAAGFTKTRVSSPTGPPKNVDALANYWGNAFQVEHYIAWAEPLAEMRAVVGHRDFRMAVESNLGAAKSAQMMRWIDDLEKSGQRNAIMNTLSGDLMQRWGSAASASALLFKVGVLLKQATAALGSAFKVGLGSYARSLGRVLSGTSSISLREAWNSDSVQRRINDYDPEMREAFQAHQKRRFENEILDVLTQYPNRALEGGWYAIGFTDAVFTTVSAAVAHDASYREGLAAGLNSEQAMAYAGEQMTLIVKETAQPDSTATKSQFENSVGNPWLRVIFAFQSANRQAFGLSLLSYKHGDKFASRLILGHLIIPIVSQTIGNMIRDGFTDADDDEIWTLKGYLASMLLGPFSGALQLGPLLEVLAQKTFGAEPRVASNPAATALTALGSILEGDFDSGDIGRVVTELSNILGGRASATGAGWNIIRQLLGLQENAENDQ